MIYVDVLGTVDVDGLATGGANYKVTGVKIHGLRLAVGIIALHTLLDEDCSTFEAIDQLLLVLLLDLREGINTLSSLLLQIYVLRVRHFHEFLS